MDKNSTKGRKRKRGNEEVEDHFWDCSICTYKNNPKAFKCLMCDVGRGTSTRKSRLNPDLAAMQVQRAQTPPPRALREDYRSSNDDGSLTRPGSSASNSSDEVLVATNTNVASQDNSDVHPTPSTPGPGPSNQYTLPSSSAKFSCKPEDANTMPKEKSDPNVTQKENNDPHAIPKGKINPNATHKETNDPNVTPKENNDPNATPKEKIDPDATQKENNYPNVPTKENNDPNATQKEKNVKPPRARAKLRNMDKKNATHHSVTVDNVTFIITEYKLKPKKEKKVKEPATPKTAHLPPPQTNNEESPNVNGGGSSTMDNNPSAEHHQKSAVQV